MGNMKSNATYPFPNLEGAETKHASTPSKIYFPI